MSAFRCRRGGPGSGDEYLRRDNDHRPILIKDGNLSRSSSIAIGNRCAPEWGVEWPRWAEAGDERSGGDDLTAPEVGQAVRVRNRLATVRALYWRLCNIWTKSIVNIFALIAHRITQTMNDWRTHLAV
jgi:hypothetical protein